MFTNFTTLEIILACALLASVILVRFLFNNLQWHLEYNKKFAKLLDELGDLNGELLDSKKEMFDKLRKRNKEYLELLDKMHADKKEE